MTDESDRKGLAIAKVRNTGETSQTEKDLQMARGNDTEQTSQVGGDLPWREAGILEKQVRQEAPANGER